MPHTSDGAEAPAPTSETRAPELENICEPGLVGITSHVSNNS